jgi:N-acetylmuramoyl-L-alanine amidase
MAFKIYQIMATESPCYKAARPMTPTGGVLHSTGANNPYLKRYVEPDDGNLGVNQYHNGVNRADHKVIAHAYIGKDKNGIVRCYQVLPFNIACWSAGAIPYDKNGNKLASSSSKNFHHYGPSYNYDPQGRIQVEVCEDGLKDEKYFNEAFDCAAEFHAYICKELNLSVDSICSHKVAHAKGYASNHGDPENWMSKFGKDMDWFRDKVRALMEDEKEDVDEKTTSDKLYRVQVGAFSNRKYAESMVKDLKIDGYNAFIVEEDVEPTPQPKTLSVGDRVRIQDNAPIWGTNKPFEPFVYDMDVYIMQIDGDRIVFSVNAKDTTGAVDRMYIE